MIKNDPIYQEETIREKARLDEVDRRKRLEEELKKKNQNKGFAKLLIMGLGLFVFIYYTLLMPLSNMVK